MGQNKEVDEWLLGSGESAETAASNNQTKNIGSGLIEATQQKSSLKTKQPKQEQPEEEDWMFRTFSKSKQVP